jgi:hypothetical protein
VTTPSGYFISGADMKKRILIMVGCFWALNLGACASNSDEQAVIRQNKAGQKETGAVQEVNKELALSFLRGVQSGDKKLMYQAAHLTADMVNSSREKLIYAAKNKLTDSQRTEYEHALRISGQIDFFVSKIRKILPATSTCKIIKTVKKESQSDSQNFVHFVTITYNNKDEAIRDKTTNPVKEMIVHLQQIDHKVEGVQIHEFSFDSKDFEKMADKDFEVVSYY